MISGETMQYQKVRRILQYHVPNKLLSSEKFAYHVILLFCPFRDEKELLLVSPPIYKKNFKRKESTIVHKVFETNSSFYVR